MSHDKLHDVLANGNSELDQMDRNGNRRNTGASLRTAENLRPKCCSTIFRWSPFGTVGSKGAAIRQGIPRTSDHVEGYDMEMLNVQMSSLTDILGKAHIFENLPNRPAFPSLSTSPGRPFSAVLRSTSAHTPIAAGDYVTLKLSDPASASQERVAAALLSE